MLERLKRRLELTENDRDALLGDLLEEAEQYILGYTGRRRRASIFWGWKGRRAMPRAA